jgi:hypothetical protein
MVYRIDLRGGNWLQATADHLILLSTGVYRQVARLNKGDFLRAKGIDGRVEDVVACGHRKVYDIKGIEDNSNFVANNVVVHNCDEAVRFATAADWAKKEHKELRRKLAQVRTKHFLYIMCFPLKVEKVEKNYLEAFSNYWIDVITRGTAAVFVKDLNPMMDSWRIQDFKQVGSYTEFTDPQVIEEKLKKHPNFWQILKYPRPPKWLYSKYLALRETNVYSDVAVSQSITRQDIYTACLLLSLKDIVAHDPSLSLTRIIKYVKDEYDVSISKNIITASLEDARQLVMKVRENVISTDNVS